MTKLKAELSNLKNNLDSIHAEQAEKRKAFLSRPDLQAKRALVLAEMTLAEQLYKARKESKLTQAELAKRMNVPQAAIARIESGRLNLTIRTVMKYADACGKRVALL